MVKERKGKERRMREKFPSSLQIGKNLTPKEKRYVRMAGQGVEG
jgi:hypothetical protein